MGGRGSRQVEGVVQVGTGSRRAGGSHRLVADPSLSDSSSTPPPPVLIRLFCSLSVRNVKYESVASWIAGLFSLRPSTFYTRFLIKFSLRQLSRFLCGSLALSRRQVNLGGVSFPSYSCFTLS